MPEDNNMLISTEDRASKADDTDREVMIAVDNLSMVFNRASEQLNSFKEYAIKLAKREVFFEGFTALSNINFEVRKGDVFGIVGTNGSGKSTLLKIIAGVMDASEGSCTVKGSIAPLIELGAGFDSELTARENVYLNGALLGYSKEFITENFEAIVTFAEVEDYLDMPLKNYSSGMVARIAFAIATVIVPEILLVDEVLSVGDFMFQRKCEDRIKELIEKHGVTVLIVSHSNDQIARLCDRALWIEKGHCRMLGEAEEVCRIYNALGGRSGSRESEQRILAATSDENALPDNAFSEISGEDSYETSVRAASAAWKDNSVETVAVACGTTHINTILANGLAGAYDAPILQTRASYLPASVKKYLIEHKPQRILYFDCGAHAQHPLETLKSLDWGPEIIEFTNSGNVFHLSKDIYSYGCEHQLWGDTVAVIDFNDNTEALAAAPLLYNNKIPVFSSSSAAPMKPDELLTILQGCTPERVLVFGKSTDDQVPSLLRNIGIEVTTYTDDDSYRACMDISELVFKEVAGSKELCFASSSLSLWQDALMCGPYCAKRDGVLLVQDSTSLDSMSACLDFVSKHKKEITSLTFFGGDSNLGRLDKELLCKEYYY